MTFTESLSARSRSAETLLCVGLDPDISRFPEHIKNGPDPVGTFCRAVIDATAQYACAFKPQIAYFAALRAESVLEALIDYIHTNHPGIPVILDAKRGDIGSTAKQYAREAFERYKADAVTLSPYMGFDTVEPYMENFPEKGIFLLGLMPQALALPSIQAAQFFTRARTKCLPRLPLLPPRPHATPLTPQRPKPSRHAVNTSECEPAPHAHFG